MKFKVGDKIRILNAGGIDGGQHLTNGEIYKIEKMGGYNFYIKDDKGQDLYLGQYERDCYVILPRKSSKNQRITVLEKEVDELKVIVHQLRESNITIEDVKRHFNIGNTSFATYEGQDLESEYAEQVKQEKTPNRLRAEIIEKAKMFIENTKLANHYQVSDAPFGSFICDVEFVVNEQKRTVVALMRSTNNKSIKSKGIAKCNPSDVFNTHIGKAIALGRALNLDVSEFKQAVQPTEVVVGHVATHKNSDIHYTISSINGDTYFTKPGGHYTKGSFTKGSAYIVNDTNAIYGGVE